MPFVFSQVFKFLHADFVMWPQDAGAEGAAAGGKGRRQAPKHGVAALRRYRYGGVLFPFIIRRMFVCVCVCPESQSVTCVG